MPPPIPPTRMAGRLWLEKGDHGFLGRGRAELLECIDELGSIAKAARALGMGYKHAWDMVEAMNNLAEAPLVERSTGGRGGGGTRLTEKGRAMIAELRTAEAAHDRFLAMVSAEAGDPERMRALLGRLALKTSARNQWWGRVSAVDSGPVNSAVTLALGGGEPLVAVITNGSLRELDIREGTEVAVLVKAPHVGLAADNHPPTAANRLCGTVDRIEAGPTDAEVTVRLPGGNTVTAVVSRHRLDTHELAEGGPACALIDASDVILAVNQ